MTLPFYSISMNPEKLKKKYNLPSGKKIFLNFFHKFFGKESFLGRQKNTSISTISLFDYVSMLESHWTTGQLVNFRQTYKCSGQNTKPQNISAKKNHVGRNFSASFLAIFLYFSYTQVSVKMLPILFVGLEIEAIEEKIS